MPFEQVEDGDYDEAFLREEALISRVNPGGTICPGSPGSGDASEVSRALFSDSELLSMRHVSDSEQLYSALEKPDFREILWVENGKVLDSDRCFEQEILCQLIEIPDFDWRPDRGVQFPLHLQFGELRTLEILTGAELSSEENDAWEEIADEMFRGSWKLYAVMFSVGKDDGNAIVFIANVEEGRHADTELMVGPVRDFDLAGRILRYLTWDWHLWSNEVTPGEPGRKDVLDKLYAYLPQDRKGHL